MMVLVVGAGALGCEILTKLFISGYTRVTIVDVDTIEVSNLNRQLLFRPKHVGKYKAQVACDTLTRRLCEAECVAHCKRIEEMPVEFFKSFGMIFCAVDQMATRLWLNAVVMEYAPQARLIELGTEGWMGHARLVVPGITSCLYCTKDLYSDEWIGNLPMCTVAGRPSKPEQCVGWAVSIGWSRSQREEFDPRKGEHQRNLLQIAHEYAQENGVDGVTEEFIKNCLHLIIPNIISTTSMTAGLAVLVAMQSGSQDGDANFWFINGVAALNWTKLRLEKNPNCIICKSLL